MTVPQPQHIGSILASLDLEHRAEVHILAERSERLVLVPRPQKGSAKQRCQERREYKRLPQDEYTCHEDEEDDHTPDEAREGDRPGLTLRLVWLIEYCATIS